MVMVFVPEGKFIMGAIDGDPYAETDELPRHEVAMSSFWIDSTEITNLQYTIFLNSNGNLIDDAGYSWYNDKARGAEIESTSDGYHSVEGFEQRPVTFVSWYGAKVYCQWGGGDLPTEAQWEYAARGPENNRFPWGNELPRNLTLNFNDSVGHTTNVGSFPAGVSWVGTFDMAGNVIEWINDWYSARYYENVPIENPSGPPTGQFRSVRGGSWQNSSEYQRSSWRNYIDNPSFRVEDVGFRCVINLKE
jgi:iron(II)-dependent oxidoreductase